METMALGPETLEARSEGELSLDDWETGVEEYQDYDLDKIWGALGLGETNTLPWFNEVTDENPNISQRVDPWMEEDWDKFLDSGKVVSAVCHAPAALLAATRDDGSWPFAGYELTGFTNTEEEQAGLADKAPWLLETRLREGGKRVIGLGALYFFFRSFRQGYFGPNSEDPKYRMLHDEEVPHGK